MLASKLLSVPSTAGPIEVSYLQTALNTTDASTYTFSNQNIGTEFSGRIVLVGVSTVLTTTAASSITSVTVNGIAATQLNVSGGANNVTTALFAVALNIGTLATVIVNFSNTMNCCGISQWTLKNATGYLTEAKPNNQVNTSNTGASQTFTFSQVKKGDAIIVVSRIRSANVNTYSMTRATERFESVVESGVSAQFGGDVMITSNESNYNIVISTTGSSPISNHTVTRFYK